MSFAALMPQKLPAPSVKAGGVFIYIRGLLWFISIMPKAIDLRLHGISFEDAVKRMLNTPPLPKSKKAKKQKRTRQKK